MRIPLMLHKLGVGSTLLHSLGLASIAGAISLWGRSASKGDKEKMARAERLAIFVGLWPPTFFGLEKVLQDIEAAPEEQAQRGREAKGETLEDALAPAA